MRTPRTDLSLDDWAVLGLLCEQQSYGWRLVTALRPGGEIGAVWTCPRSRVYRAIAHLAERGLIEREGTEESAVGPSRTLLRATGAGRRALTGWLARPVEHLRDVRSELLLKLLLHDRLQRNPEQLVSAQRQTFRALAESLELRAATSDGFEHTIALWRLATLEATMRFLDGLAR